MRNEMPFRFRPGTTDKGEFLGSNRYNIYRLPKLFDGNNIVIDIGMHIGSFSYACLQHGVNSVYGFEPDIENFNLATENLKQFGSRIHLYNKAVWRSDRSDDKLFLKPYYNGNTSNTSADTVMDENGSAVESISFDDIIRNVTNGGQKRVRLVKLDCEGSEFPILFTSKTLHLIDNICGECHTKFNDYNFSEYIPEKCRVEGVERFTMKDILDLLRKNGFIVDSVRSKYNTLEGIFFAWRRGNSIFDSSRGLIQFYGYWENECLWALRMFYGLFKKIGLVKKFS